MNAITLASRLKLVFPILACTVTLLGCETQSPPDGNRFQKMGADSDGWTCESTPPTPREMKTWCDANPNRGEPAMLGQPGSLLNLANKNRFDIALSHFVLNGVYKEKGWLHDKNWRMTGPYVGKPGQGLSYGVHPAVRIYYSPEVVNWMCAGRPADGIPDGAMIIKEMHSIDENLKIKLDSEGCMVFGASEQALDEGMSSWTIMYKDKAASQDGWYWANPYKGYKTGGNPPIVDRSAFARASDVPVNPVEPNPDMLPTGNFSNIPSQVYPYNGFGVACLNCHGSAEVESSFASLENIMTEGIRYKGFALNEVTKPNVKNNAIFPIPYSQPKPEFLEEYNQLHAVSFSRAWQLRFPSETYDHQVAIPNMAPSFLTSDQCIGCHDATISNDALPNMMFTEADGTLINLSMYGEWRVSPMGLAGRDPIFFSQLQSETNNLPDLAECIENTCLHCHGVLGQRQFSRDTKHAPDAGKCTSLFPIPPPNGVPEGSPFPMSMMSQWQNNENEKTANYGALGRDGISCMACHQMEANNDSYVATKEHYAGLSEEQPYYTGNFLTTDKNEIFGPIKDSEIVPKPMEHVVGLTPKYGDQITKSEMCGNCHNILLPEITNSGQVVGASYEQTTHLEWVNSDFSKQETGMFQSCQDCHMPHTYNGEKLSFKVANIESNEFAPTTDRLPDSEITLTDYDQYSRHTLHGLNIFLNQMFQQFPEVLGVRQIDYMNGNNRPSLLTGQDSMLEMAKYQTAEVNITNIERRSNRFDVNVSINNKVGHFLPSGVGFRRMFIEFGVYAKDNSLLWASGRTDENGFILKGTTQEILPTELPIANPKVWQPHYQSIHSGSQVQIYQEVILDSDSNVTTSFLRRIQHVKDNRIRPKGFDPLFYLKQSSKYIKALASLDGVKGDPYYENPKLTGSDSILYSVRLSPDDIRRVDRIEVTLYSQSIPPGYLQQRFRDANRGPKNKSEIERLYYLTSHLNVQSPTDRQGKPFLQNWKLKVSETAIKKI